MRHYWPEYVSVREKKAKAVQVAQKMKKKGADLSPVIIAVRTITTTFWGNSWCKHLESYSDYENRLPRGRSYVRNNAVIDLKIAKGAISALVSGSSVYTVKIAIKALSNEKWKTIVQSCTGKIDSLIELLQGKLSKKIMEVIIEKNRGIFPQPSEISLDCSCPDHASMCKHIAAVLYGVGARLDDEPEKLFLLRQVDHLDLIGAATSTQKFAHTEGKMDESDLSSLFDIELDSGNAQEQRTKPKSSAEKQKKTKKETTTKQVKIKKQSASKKPKKSKKEPAKKAQKKIISKTKAKIKKTGTLRKKK